MKQSKNRPLFWKILRYITIGVFYLLTYYLASAFSGAYDKVYEENSLLKEQNELYKKVAKVELSNSDNNTDIRIIKIIDSKLKNIEPQKDYSQDLWGWILVGTFLVFHFSLRFIDKNTNRNLDANKKE